MSLTEAGLLRAAGETSFHRGEDYVRYVHGSRVVGEKAEASIQAKRVDLVELDWLLGRAAWCVHLPTPRRGTYFCKHLVAVGARGHRRRARKVASAKSLPVPLASYVELAG